MTKPALKKLTSGPHSSGDGRASVARGTLLVAGSLAALMGCADLRGIDRKIDLLVASRTDSVGGGAGPPRTRFPDPQTFRDPEQAVKVPDTVNPPADELTFVGAPDDRDDVLPRLEGYADFETGARTVTFENALRIAQETSRQYITAEEEYILAAIRLLIERHLWSPRFFNDLSTIYTGRPGTSGNYATALNIINEFRATQRLPYGGEVEARLITEASRQLSDVVGDRTERASRLVLSANIPFLRNAGLIAQEDLIQAERDLIYAARDFEDFRRAFFVDIARDYFSLLAQRAVIRNQEARLQSVINFLEQTRALVAAGRNPPFQARNVEQNVLSSRNALINQREAYILALDRFKIRLGLPVEINIRIEPIQLTLDDPDVTVEQAARTTLRFRLDYQNQLDRIDDARRAVANARNQLLPDLDASVAAGFNDEDSLGFSFDARDTNVTAGVTFGLPLDREIERLRLRSTIIGFERQTRDTELFRDNLILDARSAVREIDRSRFSLRLQEQTVAINELRLEELRIKADEIDTQTRLDAENELLQARNNRDAAERDLRTAILDYLRITGQLRVRPDGSFQPLKGMLVREAPAPRPPLSSPEQTVPDPLASPPIEDPVAPPR